MEEERERTSADITEAEKAEYVQSIRDGLNPQQAANALGYKGRCFRALRSPNSPFYDEDFAAAFADAYGSPEARLFALERMRGEVERRALLDSDRLAEKWMMVHDPDWSVLRQKDVNVNVTAYIQQHLKSIPTEFLEQLLSYMESGGEIVEADVRALPRAVGEAA